MFLFIMLLNVTAYTDLVAAGIETEYMKICQDNCGLRYGVLSIYHALRVYVWILREGDVCFNIMWNCIEQKVLLLIHFILIKTLELFSYLAALFF